MAGQELRRSLADMRDAEREDEAVERDLAPRRDGGEEVAGAGLSPPFPVFEAFQAAGIARFEGEDVLRSGDEALGVEFVDPLLAEAFDVEGIAGDEMLQPLPRLRGADEPARAAAHSVLLAGAGVYLTNRVAAAGRALGR